MMKVSTPEKKIEDMPAFKELVKEWEDFLDLKVNVFVELGRKKMTVREFLELDIGSIVDLRKSAGESMDIYINGSYFGKGEVTVIENTFGLRITEIYDRKEI